MFREKIKILFDILEVSNQEISRYAGCSPSGISRLKSGARKPGPASPTVDKFINGVIQYAAAHNKSNLLIDIAGVSGEESLHTGIKKWLYDKNNHYPDKHSKNIDKDSCYPSFSEKLNGVMNLCEMSNVKLARAVNVDTSYISRFRKGNRSPKSNPELLDRICTALFEYTALKGHLPELADMMHIPISSFYDSSNNIKTNELYLRFHIWMDDFSANDQYAIKHLLETIDTFTPNINIDIPPLEHIVPEDILNDKTDIYQGITGLQRAVLRFLGCAVRDHYDELLLYSDQGMEWMVENEDFRKRWAALMALCVRQGTHIKIIHNIDRDITEMISAVESWMPLYTSGMIKSYYNRKSCGTRFKHTIFLCPDRACIAACHTNGMDNKSIYNYYTEPIYLDYMKENYESLLLDSDSLATIEQGGNANAENNIISQDDFSNLSLSILQNKVEITKNSMPKLTITFTHPLLCNAFQAYAEYTKQHR